MKIVVLAGGTSTEREISIVIRNRNLQGLKRERASGHPCGRILWK